MDNLTPEQRKKNMQSIKSKGSKIEIILQNALTERGYDFTPNDKDIIGCPDIVFKEEKIAIFCDGEYWHGFNWETRKNNIKSNKNYWIQKIERNMKRDIEINELLKNNGWIVLRFWGNEIKKNIEECIEKIETPLLVTSKTPIKKK